MSAPWSRITGTITVSILRCCTVNSVSFWSNGLEANHAYFENTPQKRRSDLLEETALDHIARLLPLSARRGAFKSITSAVRDQVEAGFQQSERTRCYIAANATPVFENADGSVALELNKTNIREIYALVPTLEPLGFIVLQLSVLRELRLLAGANWPWCVYINDRVSALSGAAHNTS
jgi:hypothetical protein